MSISSNNYQADVRMRWEREERKGDGARQVGRKSGV